MHRLVPSYRFQSLLGFIIDGTVIRVVDDFLYFQSLLGFINMSIPVSQSTINAFFQSLLGFIKCLNIITKREQQLSIPFGIYRIYQLENIHNIVYHFQSLLGFIPIVENYEPLNNRDFQSLLGFIVMLHSLSILAILTAFNPFWDLSRISQFNHQVTIFSFNPFWDLSN